MITLDSKNTPVVSGFDTAFSGTDGGAWQTVEECMCFDQSLLNSKTNSISLKRTSAFLQLYDEPMVTAI